MTKFFSGLERRGGIVGDLAVVMVYNAKAPERSKVIVERLHDRKDMPSV